MSYSESENQTSISTWKVSDSEYSQEKEFKIERLHALNKVVFSGNRLYALDLQGNIHIINVEQEKVEKCMMNEQLLPNGHDSREQENPAPAEED